MKKSTFHSAAVLAYCLLFTSYSFPEGTAINATGAAADNSAMPDVNSTTKGLLLPRLTSSERNSIVSPAQSLLIFSACTETTIK